MADEQQLGLEAAKQVFPVLETRRAELARRYETSLRYYRNRNDITLPLAARRLAEQQGVQSVVDANDLFHKAHNRIPSAFHRILVDQKAQYVGGTPPQVDVGDDRLNEQVAQALGDGFDRVLVRLVIDASLAGTGWLHYWEDTQTGQFHYARVEPTQMCPIYDENLDQRLLAARRAYDRLDPASGLMMAHDEYWTAQTAQFFIRQQGQDYSQLLYDYRLPVWDVSAASPLDNSSLLQHGLGEEVPFIPFMNNQLADPDLPRYKELIDVFDKTLSGFVNDLDDIQQVFLILTNYGGADDAEDFKRKLKLDKFINLDNNGESDKSGVSTLTIDIPTQARDDLLERCRELIFLQGQGVDPQKVQQGVNNSGVALKMLYSLLELKAAAVESEFRPAVAQLVRAVLRHLGDPQADTRPISQTWTRSDINDDLERSQIVMNLQNVTSREAIAKANPLVEDWQDELEQRQADTTADQYQASPQDGQDGAAGEAGGDDSGE